MTQPQSGIVCVYGVRPAFGSYISCFLNRVSLLVVLLPLCRLLPEFSLLFQECNSDVLALSVAHADTHEWLFTFSHTALNCTLPCTIYIIYLFFGKKK